MCVCVCVYTITWYYMVLIVWRNKMCYLGKVFFWYKITKEICSCLYVYVVTPVDFNGGLKVRCADVHVVLVGAFLRFSVCAQSFLIPCHALNCNLPSFSVLAISGCYFLFQGLFQTQRLNLSLLRFQHHRGFFTTEPSVKPFFFKISYYSN